MRLGVIVRATAEELLKKKLTLVDCRNKTNGRFDLIASSCSTPIIIPLSIRTAVTSL